MMTRTRCGALGGGVNHMTRCYIFINTLQEKPAARSIQSPDSHTTVIMPCSTFSLISMNRLSICRFPSVIIVSFAQSRISVIGERQSWTFYPFGEAQVFYHISRIHLIHMYACVGVMNAASDTLSGTWSCLFDYHTMLAASRAKQVPTPPRK